MTAQTAPNAPVPGMAERPGRKRHWLRWILITVAALVVVIVAVTAAAIKLQPTPAPLALPATAAAPVGQLDGAWRITSGSVAGFRIQQTVLALHTDVVGRTEDVAGAVTITGGQVTAANIRINLLTLTSGGKKPAPQFAASLATDRFPNATVALEQPVALGSAASGDTVTLPAAGQLTLHGVTHAVSVPLKVRRDGADLRVVGSFPVALSDWGIAQPKGYGALGSLADHGTAEFLLVLAKA